MAEYRTAIASYSFHQLLEEKKIDVFRYLDLLKYRYGVANADLWTGFLPTLEEDFLKKIRAELDRRELTLANLCVDGPHLWADDPEERQAHKTKMLEYLRAAKLLGAQTVRVDFGGTDGHTMPEEAFDFIVKTYREYCDFCGGEGMRVGPENHWGWDRVPEYLEKVKAAVDHPAYGHLYHFGNFYDEQERGEKLVLTYAMHTHVPANSVPFAKGIIRDLAAAGYKGVFSVEHHSGVLEEERVEWQLACVRGMIAELRLEEAGAEPGPDYFSGNYR